MVSAATKGIRVSVISEFKSEYSNLDKNFYVFAYRIRIANDSNRTVQLLRRHWDIRDSIGQQREVEGEGVIGQQPVIHPGEWHEYDSACDLRSDMGVMSGYYEMIEPDTQEVFRVTIPAFEMVVPHKLN